MAQWFIIYGGQSIGPMSREQLLNYGLNPQSKVWTEGMPEWVDAYTVPELMDLINSHSGAGSQSNGHQVPPPQPVYPQNYGGTDPYGKPAKSHIAAGVFALVLGGVGAHYFYTNHIGAAILTIVLNIVTCGIWGIVVLVQGILLLTMSQEEFERKYLNTDSFMPF